MAGMIRTLVQMRSEARLRADMEYSTNVSDATVDRWLNQGIAKLYDLLIKSRGEEYYLRSVDFSTVAGVASYQLPPHFYKLLALDIVETDNYFACAPLNFQTERNYGLGVDGLYNINDTYRYMLQGNYIKLYPTPTEVRTMRLFYLPAAPELGVLDVLDLDFVHTSGSDIITVTGGVDNATGTDLSANNAAAMLWPGSTIQYPTPWTVAPIVTHVEGLSVYVSEAASSSATVTAKQVDNPAHWDGINGWEEFAVLDAAIKLVAREERDTSHLDAERAEQAQRIAASSPLRDFGAARTVQDVNNAPGLRRR